MVRAICSALLSALLLLGAAPKPGPITDYRITTVVEGGSSALDVELRFTGDADGTTRLRLPERWAEVSGLHRNVSRLTVSGAKMREEGPAARSLTHPPGGPVVVRWRVSGQAGRALQFGPDSLVVVTEAALIRPEGLENRPAEVRWTGVPGDWRKASDIEHLPGGRASSLRELMDSVLIAGRDLEVRNLSGGARVSILGPFGFPPEEFAAEVERIGSAAQAYWNEARRPFLVALIADRQPGAGQNGAGLGDAFLLHAASGNRVADLSRVTAHEYLHAWTPRRLGGVRPAEDQRLDAWFSEGVTDFIAFRLLLRSGAWSPERYVGNYNQILAAYAVSPERNASNQRIKEAFWSNRGLERLPYQRGLLLATVWDARLREATGGARDLDDVLRAVRTEAGAAGEHGRGPTAPERFVAAYRRLGGGDLRSDISRYVDRGELVRLPADVFGDCAGVTSAGERQQIRLAEAEGQSRNCVRRLAGE